MKRMLIMILVLSMVAVIAVPAFAEVQNIKVTGSVIVRGFYRDNYGTTGSGGARAFTTTGFLKSTGASDWYNTQTRLGVAADLTDNVAASILLSNERDWQNAATNSSTIMVQSSYITIREMLYSPLTVQVGKMPLNVADKLVIGDGTTTSTLRASDYQDDKSFDGIVGILDYDPLTVVLATVKIADGTATNSDDIDAYILDGIYKFEDDMNTVLDAYYVNVHYGIGTAAPGGGTQPVDVNVLAAVLTADVAENLSAKIGVALQTGDYMKTATASRNLDAMAIDLGVEYAVEGDYSPKVGLKYVFRSGEEAGNAGDYEGWLPLNEDQVNGVIYDPNTNIKAIAITASAVPADRLTVGCEYWLYTLDQPAVAANTATRTTDDDAGSEFDITARYAYTEDVSMGLGVAWFFPGGSYRGANGANPARDETATQIMLELGVKF